MPVGDTDNDNRRCDNPTATDGFLKLDRCVYATGCRQWPCFPRGRPVSAVDSKDTVHQTCTPDAKTNTQGPHPYEYERLIKMRFRCRTAVCSCFVCSSDLHKQVQCVTS